MRFLTVLSSLIGPSLVATVLIYHAVVEIDAGWLAVSDDKAMMAQREQHGLMSVVTLYAYHFVPTFRLAFLVLPALFGTWWTPYGVLLLASHAGLAATVGALVWRFGRSLPIAVAMALLVATTMPLSTGVTTSFGNALLYLLVSCILLTAIAADAYRCRPFWPRWIVLGLVPLWAIGTVLSGGLAYLYAVLTYAGLRRAEGKYPAVESRDLGFVAALATSLLIFAALYAVPIQQAGWHSPTDMLPCSDGRTIPERFTSSLGIGWWGPLLGILPDAPGGLEVWDQVALAVNVVLVVGSVAPLGLGWVRCPEHRRLLAVLAATATLTLATAAMLISGRGCPLIWNVRYNVYQIAAATATMGLALSLLIGLLPERARTIVTVLALVLAVWTAVGNVGVIESKADMLRMRAPGFALQWAGQ